MNGTYRALAGRIRSELPEIQKVVERSLDIWKALQENQSTQQQSYLLDAVALNLHGFYAGIERLLLLIAERIDQSTPSSAAWHQELLRQMSAEVSGIRPAVLSAEVRDRLDRFRGFRHVVRNVYTYNLDAQQVGVLIAYLPDVMDDICRELLIFADLLEDIG